MKQAPALEVESENAIGPAMAGNYNRSLTPHLKLSWRFDRASAAT